MVRCAVIGTGLIGKARHIPNILHSPHATLAGVYNRSPDHTRADAQTYGCRAYETLDALLSDRTLDAVVICSPTTSHCELSMAALAAGKHVLCEKPMAVNTAEAERLARAAEASGKKFMLSHNQRYYQPHKKAKELLDAGVIGTLMNFRTFLGTNLPLPPAHTLDNDASNEVMSHRVDLMHHLLDSAAAGVFARLTRWDGESERNRWVDLADDTAMAIIAYQNGVMGSFVASRVIYNGNDRLTHFFGTKGSLKLYGDRAPVVVELQNGEVIDYTLPHVPSQRLQELTEIDDEFFLSILEDRPVPITARDGLEVVRTVEAVWRSNVEQRWIEP